MKRSSLRQILLVFSLAGLLPTVLPLGFLIFRGQDMARQEAVGDLRSLTYALSAQYSMVFASAETTLAELSSVEPVASAGFARCSSWLSQNWANATFVRDIFRVSSDGAVTCASNAAGEGVKLDIGFDPNDPAIYSQIELAPVRISRSSGAQVIGLYKTFWNDGQPFRLMMTLDASWFEATVRQVSDLTDERIVVLDEEGIIVFALPETMRLSGQKVPTFERIIAPRQDPIVHEIDVGFNGEKRISSSVTLHQFADGRRLYMSVTASPEMLFATSTEILVMGGLTLAIAVVGIILSQWLVFARYIQRPIGEIVSFTKALKDGSSESKSALSKAVPEDLVTIADAMEKVAYENSKRAEALSEAMQNLERAEEVARLGHWRLDLQSNELFWSDGIYRIHGLSPDSFTPTLENAVECYHPDDRASMMTLVERSIKTGEPFDTVKRIVRSDGAYLYVRSRGFVTHDQAGEAISVFGIFIDVDAPRRAVRELERAQSAAQDLAETRARLLATVSHEIKTPVAAILEICRQLGSCDEVERAENLTLIDATGQMLLAVVGDLLDASAHEAGRLNIRTDPVNVRCVLEDCFNVFSAANQQSGVEFSVDVAPDVPETLELDAQRLRQVLFNLLSNAFKHTPKGTISLIAKAEAGTLKLSVRDSGRGLTLPDQERIFDPFEKLGNAGGSVPSTGLGLSIVKTLVEQMQGSITVQSKPDEGAVFTVSLPLKVPSSMHEQPAGQSAALQEVNQPILIVEDNPVNQKLLTAFLTKRGFPFVLQGDGQSAMEWLLGLDPDDTASHPYIALIDINMPRLDGIGLSEFIRRQWAGDSELPIYLVTADIIADHDHAIKDMAINGFISKPIDFTSLTDILTSVSTDKRSAA